MKLDTRHPEMLSAIVDRNGLVVGQATMSDFNLSM